MKVLKFIDNSENESDLQQNVHASNQGLKKMTNYKNNFGEIKTILLRKKAKAVFYDILNIQIEALDNAKKKKS